jgi:hypothetical protein
MIGNDKRSSEAGPVTNVIILREENISAVDKGVVPYDFERIAERT